ncbi:MAG: FliI/YscN family ATPase [Geminicoccaceae bacterium]
MNQIAPTSSHHLEQLLQAIEPRPQKGRVIRATGTVIHAAAPDVAVGDLCRLKDPNSGCELLAEAVGLAGETVVLTPIGDMTGLSTQTEVVGTGAPLSVAVGPALLGQTLNSLGQRRAAAVTEERHNLVPDGDWTRYPIRAEPPDALERQLISRPMPLGIRVIDGLLTCGEGQRIGIFGAPGTGKSSLLASIVKGAEADVAVVALIGERGREVREFIERHLGEEGRKKSVLVVATSDRSAMERVKAAYVATAIAEYFRDRDQRVLLLIDSITRFARAQREIGLAAGEPPTRRGFPPSVFAELPALMERAGNGSRGSITAFYSVLVEGDGAADPIAEEARSILDGHITLSPKLGGAGHYPAIDVLESRSRVMDSITSSSHIQAANHVRALLARHQEIELLLRVGEYQAGSDPLADEAVAKIEAIRAFLKQGEDERTGFPDMLQRLEGLMS